MELIAIHPHALKHGLTETDITCAWNSAFAWFRRDLENGGIDYVLVGLDGKTASWSSLLDVAPTEMVTSWWRAQTWCKSVPRSVAASPDVTPS